MTYDIIVSGQLSADLLPDVSMLSPQALASPGKLYEVGPMVIATGGAVPNTGLALHRLGAQVGLMTVVGDDVLGQVVTDQIAAHDPRLTALFRTRADVATSYSIVLSPQHADRIILDFSGTNDTFDVGDVDFDAVSHAKIFHLGYPPLLPRMIANRGQSLFEIFPRVHEMDVITSLDTSLPAPGSASADVDWREILGAVLPYVDVFLPSIEEIIVMLRPAEYAAAEYAAWDGDVFGNLTRAYISQLAREILAMGPGVVGFKLGEYGMYLLSSDDAARLEKLSALGVDVSAWRGVELWHPAYDVRVVGTLGAGDCAYGGFLAALLRGLSPHDAIRLGCAAGACNVEAADAFSGLLDWEGLWGRIGAGWGTRPGID